jgi:hypothetical protein
LFEIFTDSHKIALNSKDPATARARFELAVEVYHQLMSIGLLADRRSSVEAGMTTLVDQFAIQVCLNEALGLFTKARKLKTARRKLEYLHRARDVLHAWLAENPTGASAIQGLHNDVLADISQLETIAVDRLASRET